jgi:hypothetical protein
MSEESPPSNLPAQIADAIGGLAKGFVPAAVKALDRLIGAGVDIPVAWLAQQKARIDAKTQAFVLVDQAIAKAAASGAIADQGTIERALDVLVRKEYRKQTNREAVATAMLEDLRTENDQTSPLSDEAQPSTELDEDWLNVFERYAEDASTERMQKLWGRVLAGEVRKPGRFSMRTLRFLSEFSQADALLFSDFCNSVFGGFAPNTLVKSQEPNADISSLLNLEAAGLIAGGSGLGLSKPRKFNSFGYAFVVEGNLAIQFKGVPDVSFSTEACVLTPLGQELTYLLPGRDLKAAARNVALAMRTGATEAAYLVAVTKDKKTVPMEVLWMPPEPAVEAAPTA